MSSAIMIEKMTPITGAGKIAARTTFVIAGKVRVIDAKVIHEEGKKPWVALPDREYLLNGKRQFAPMLQIIDRDLKKMIDDAVLAAYADIDTTTAATAGPAPTGWK